MRPQNGGWRAVRIATGRRPVARHVGPVIERRSSMAHGSVSTETTIRGLFPALVAADAAHGAVAHRRSRPGWVCPSW